MDKQIKQYTTGKWTGIVFILLSVFGLYCVIISPLSLVIGILLIALWPSCLRKWRLEDSSLVTFLMYLIVGGAVLLGFAVTGIRLIYDFINELFMHLGQPTFSGLRGAYVLSNKVLLDFYPTYQAHLSLDALFAFNFLSLRYFISFPKVDQILKALYIAIFYAMPIFGSFGYVARQSHIEYLRRKLLPQAKEHQPKD